MHVNFEYRASFHSKGQGTLERLAKKSIETFFNHCENCPDVTVIVYNAVVSNEQLRQNFIRVQKTSPDPNYAQKNALPVLVYTEGTQGLVATLQLKGKSLAEVATIVAGGPYKYKSRNKSVVTAGAEELPAEESKREGAVSEAVLLLDGNQEETPLISSPSNSEVIAPLLPSKVSQMFVEPTPRLTPREKLERAGRGDDIERIKQTLASILVEFHQGSLDNIDNTLKVPVSLITRAIFGHMKLEPNDTGTYRGIVASFYSSTISLFGYKDASAEVSVDEDAKYSDWIMDAVLIVDFVGGKDKLAYLAHERKREIEVRAREASKPKDTAPTAQVVETMLQQGFSKDGEVLQMVAKMLAAQEEAEGKAVLARENEQALTNEVSRLEAQLEEARSALADATLSRVQAESNVKRFILSKDIMQDIRDIKVRFDYLMKRLGF